MKPVLFAVALVTAPCVHAQSLQQRVEAKLAEAVPGTRFGLVVADETGKEIVAVNPDGRFMPASNTKMFTTAAAFATLPTVNQPDAEGGASVRIEGENVVLEGHGDARLSSADDCKTDCLATLADAVAAKTRHVRDVIGDDSFFPDQRWSPGMSWNNIPTESGTGISALTLDDNTLKLTITPAKAGVAPLVALPGYYRIDNQAQTVPGDKMALGYDRDPNGRLVRISGTIGADAKPKSWDIGIDDPADYAAWRLRAMLVARGVKVGGTVQVRHRPLAPNDDPAVRGTMPVPQVAGFPALARLTPPPLAEDLRHINKVSQNVHAELALRRLGRIEGSGSIADGVAKVGAMLAAAGAPRSAWDFSDGSGMSSYNRIAPRGTVTLLRWIAAQPWGAQWRDTLPIGGTDGTLTRRFKGTPLEGKLFAKTGTLNATNTLSGYLIARSGKTLTFSFLINDIPADAGATPIMDATLQLIADAN
ncbi:D-alanyl-D-alanine carboxypeptidase/D-alanyl-D-alanine-endopeptidase [Sphingomonas sp. MMS12-HWE2-04]|uniref:D-alanyl-D-alanine carboxypeptidase/D-alanyl-D-alanine endopeptidase n=1 Tax=Sphingomonas sp. MMS12-HWE2-04 TaxID=3234199 RepID=UPI003850431E